MDWEMEQDESQIKAAATWAASQTAAFLHTADLHDIVSKFGYACDIQSQHFARLALLEACPIFAARWAIFEKNLFAGLDPNEPTEIPRDEWNRYIASRTDVASDRYA